MLATREAQLTNGKDRSIYKNNEAFLPSFYWSRHMFILFHVRPHFSPADFCDNNLKRNITNTFRLPKLPRI